MRRRIVSESDVCAALSDFAQQIVDCKRIDSDIQLRILRTERGQHFVNQGVDIAFTDGQLDMALLKSLQGMKLIFEFLLLRPIASPELEQVSRGLGRLDAS